MKLIFPMLLCWCAIILFVSCSKISPVTPPLPPVKTDSSTFLIHLATIFDSDSESGVMFHDITGKLLRFATFYGRDTILFTTHDSLPGNKIDVTFFTAIDHGSAGIQYDLESFLYNDLGQQWIVNNPADSSGGYTQTGTFQIQLNGINTDGHYNASDKDGYALDGNDWDYPAHTLNSSVPLIGNNTDYLVHYWDPGIQPGYTFLHNVQANSTYNLNVQDFRPYDNTVPVNFPASQTVEYSVNNVANINSPYRGFVLDGSFGSGPGNFDSAVTQVTLGYLDTFAVYHTYLEASYDSSLYGYEGVGAAPSSIDLPLSAHFSIINNSIANYQNSSGQDYVQRFSSWFYSNFPVTPQEFISWNVYAAPGTQQHFLELPPEFSTKYPDLTFTNLIFLASKFYITGPSYNDLINALFKQIPLPATYENHYVTMYK